MSILTLNCKRVNSETDYSDVPYSELPDPKVACNEYPNPPWNTVQYDWNAQYPVCSSQWFAQHMAKTALKCGLKYGTRDVQKEQRDNLEQYLITRGDRLLSSNRDHDHNDLITHDHELSTLKKVDIPMEQKNEMRITAGVVTDTHLCYIDHGKPIKRELPQVLTNVGAIMQLCLDHNLRSVWIYPRTALSEAATSDFIEAARPTWEFKSIQYTDGPPTETKYCKFLSGWKVERAENESKRTVYVGYAEHNEDWGLEDVTSPLPLIAALTYLEKALGVPVLFSAGKVGTMLMEDVNKKERTEWIQHIDIRRIPALQDVYIRDASWKRSLTEEELNKGYLVAYDKTMQYPASATSVLLGSGEPVYTDHPQFDLKKSLPGIWHCKISGTSQFDGVNLPHPTDGMTEGWFYTYTVKLLHEVGYTVEICEAWIWQEGHTILRPWAETVRDAYSSLHDDWQPDTTLYKNAEARVIAAKAIKHLARKTLGWTKLNDALLPSRKDETLDWYIRPDWNGLVIDNARYQMFWRIRSYLDKGYTPIGIHVDCLYYLAGTADHSQALPHMMERKNPKTKQYEPAHNKLGGYKPHYKTPITVEEVAPLFNDESLDMGQVNKALHTIDREHQKESN